MIKTEELKNALSSLDAISPNRTTMPILKTLLLEASGGKLRISATDLEQSLTMIVNCRNPGFSCCVPSSELKAIVSTIRDSEIEFELKEKNLVLKDGKNETKFSYYPAEEYPVISYSQNPFQIDGQILKSSLLKAQIAASEDRSHPVLTGVNLRSKDSRLTIESADGFRLSQIKMMIGTPDFHVTIPTIDRRVLSLFDGKLDVSISDEKVIISNEVFTHSTNLLDGKFPEIDKVVPTTKNTSIKVIKSDLQNAVKRAMVFAKNTDSVISFNLQDQVLIISSRDGTGQNTVQLNVESQGSDIDLAVNGKYILDFLSVCSEIALMELVAPTNPIVLKSVGNDTFIHLIMPMSLR